MGIIFYSLNDIRNVRNIYLNNFQLNYYLSPLQQHDFKHATQAFCPFSKNDKKYQIPDEASNIPQIIYKASFSTI